LALTLSSRSFHDENLCQWLLKHGADPNARCYLDITPLSVALQEAPFAIVKLLFEYGGSVKYGQLLHYAVRRDAEDYLEVLNFILDKSPPINQVMFQNDAPSYEMQKEFGIQTPLHEAVVLGKIDAVNTLLARGADPNVKAYNGQSSFETAKLYGNEDILSLLRQQTSAN
jgi:ankyrin repeat protein